MLGGSNRDYYRVHVSAHTALTSTAILILTLGAATARERGLRPTAADGAPVLPFLSLSLPLVPRLSFFYLLSGICHDALCLARVFLSRSPLFPLDPASLSLPLGSPRRRYDFSDTRTRRLHTVARTRRDVAAARRRRLAIDVGRIRNFDTRRSLSSSLSLWRARAPHTSSPWSLAPSPFFSLSPSLSLFLSLSRFTSAGSAGVPEMNG